MPERKTSDRELSVAVFGAGGFTGRRVAAHLAARAAETGLRWAPAGRNPGRIAERLSGDGVEGFADPIAADVEDPASLRELAARTDVLLNLVGPYTTFGEPVIAACVERGAHYVDLTGEIPFVRQMLERYGAEAGEAGVKVVQVCGFECLPVDLLTSLAVDTLFERDGIRAAVVDLIVGFRPPPGKMRTSDGLSGGTAQSMAAVLGSSRSELIRDPAALVEDEGFANRVRQTSPIEVRPRRSESAVLAPMQPAAFINPAVIHLTSAIRNGEAEGGAPPYRYREGILLPGAGASTAPRLLAAGALAGVQTAFAGLTRAPGAIRAPIAQIMSKALPSSGFGPESERMEGWKWSMTATATGPGGERAVAQLDADGHPGYLATGRMVGEAGMLLSEPGATPDRSGFLTPATALGTDNVDRFAKAGLRFNVRG